MKAPATLTLLFLLPLFLLAQPDRNQKFAAAGYLGLNLSQIDGDYYFGYNKAGVRFGIETQYLLRPKYFFTVGIGFAQLGARPTRKEVNERGGNAVTLRLNTVEIPVMFNYRLGNKSATGKKQDYGLFRSTTVQAGLMLNRLTSYRISERGATERLPRNRNFTSVEEQFQDFDLTATIGFTVRVGLHGAIFVQHHKSILGLYRPGDVGLDDVLPLFPYALTMGFKYVLY